MSFHINLINIIIFELLLYTGTISVTRDIAVEKTGKVLVPRSMHVYVYVCCSGGGREMHKENQTRQFQTMINAMKTKTRFFFLSGGERHFRLDGQARHQSLRK